MPRLTPIILYAGSHLEKEGCLWISICGDLSAAHDRWGCLAPLQRRDRHGRGTTVVRAAPRIEGQRERDGIKDAHLRRLAHPGFPDGWQPYGEFGEAPHDRERDLVFCAG